MNKYFNGSFPQANEFDAGFCGDREDRNLGYEDDNLRKRGQRAGCNSSFGFSNGGANQENIVKNAGIGTRSKARTFARKDGAKVHSLTLNCLVKCTQWTAIVKTQGFPQLKIVSLHVSFK